MNHKDTIIVPADKYIYWLLYDNTFNYRNVCSPFFNQSLYTGKFREFIFRSKPIIISDKLCKRLFLYLHQSMKNRKANIGHR